VTPILVIAQAIAAILLGAVGLFPSLQRPGGGLNRKGYILLGLGAVAFLSATVSVQALNDADANRKQRRIEGLIDRYFSVTAEFVMTTPRAPTVPIRATLGGIITIANPRDDAKVEQRGLIGGTASDSIRDVWVIVHPMDTSSYWVQPRVSVRSGGVWSGMAYFGRSGDLDNGKRFEVVAIAEPQDTLREGEYGNSWPKAKWTSRPITLIRK
jgi:hypothetical protein